MKKALCILISFVFLSACEGKKAAIGTPGGNYLAKISDTVITEDDINKELKALPPSVQRTLSGEGGMKMLLDEMVKKELLYLEAKRKGIDGRETFKKKVDDFRKLAMVRLLLEDEIENKTAVSDQEVRNFYNKNKSEFVMRSPDNKTSTALEFDKVKDLIRQRLSAEKQQEAFDFYIETLRKSYSVNLNEDAIRKLDKQTRPEEQKSKKKEAPEKAKKDKNP